MADLGVGGALAGGGGDVEDALDDVGVDGAAAPRLERPASEPLHSCDPENTGMRVSLVRAKVVPWSGRRVWVSYWGSG